MVYSHRARPSQYRCSKCRRTLTIDDVTWRTGADFVAAIERAGWTMAPAVLCALHTAAAEAYSRPDYRRAGYLASLSGAPNAAPSR